jgi:hypothetical protein
MRVHHLLDGPHIQLTNEEKDFIDAQRPEINVRSLRDRDFVVAQNLVRKGIYEISTDSQTLHLKDAQAPKKYS